MNATITNAVHSVDRSFLFIFGASAILLVLLTAAMIWFVIRYSRKRHPVPADFDGNIWAEIVWTVLPTILVMGMFWSGWTSYRALRDVPPDALTVKVTARMWSWSFEYPNGRISPELVVPVGQPIKLELTSKDVIHGFYAPAFRIKIDTVPGMTTYAWFRADQPGEHIVYCSVYCGLQHTKMLSSIRAVSREEHDAFLAQPDTALPEATAHPGRELFESKGCIGCHSLDGSQGVGPSLNDVFGRKVTLLDASRPNEKEKTVVADEQYVRQAIMGPKTYTVKGFDPVMPEYSGQLTPQELNALIEFLMNGTPLTSTVGIQADVGLSVAERHGCLGCHSVDGSILAGPSLKGMFGGKTMSGKGVVDQTYVTEVLKNPTAKLGASTVMPAFPDLKPDELTALMDLLTVLGQTNHADHAKHTGHDAKP